MPLQQESTLGFGDESSVDYLDQLEEAIGGNWSTVENARAFQCDLGYGMCSLLVEHSGDKWVGKLSAVNPPVHEKTKRCEDLEAAILKLRVLIRDHGLLLQERGEQLVERACGCSVVDKPS